jgi:hypothetical protein
VALTAGLDPSAVVLLGAAALHLGFQLTVSVLVYPALVRSPATGWAAVHDRHSRAVTPLVAVVYAVLLGASAWAAVAGPVDGGLVLCWAGAAVALGTTAIVAAPLHGRLGREGPVPHLLRRLVVTDRVRTTAAAVCALGALLHGLRP